VHKPYHPSVQWVVGWHCKRCQEPGQGHLKPGTEQECKDTVFEDDRGNCGENYSKRDQTSLGLEEAKVLKLKKQWLGCGEK